MGKLSKDTTEADVKEHFMRFGYVLDVYLPRGVCHSSTEPFCALFGMCMTGLCLRAGHALAPRRARPTSWQCN